MKNPKKRMLLSKLSHAIIFLKNTVNSEVEEAIWDEIYKCFAEILPLSDCNYLNVEGLGFGNFITEEYYLFRIRYTNELDKTMRIKYRNKLYNIKRIVNIKERDKLLNIIALEIV